MTEKVGFARLSAKKRAKLGAEGGRRAQKAGTAHQFTPKEAAEAGRLGAKKRWEGHVKKVKAKLAKTAKKRQRRRKK